MLVYDEVVNIVCSKPTNEGHSGREIALGGNVLGSWVRLTVFAPRDELATNRTRPTRVHARTMAPSGTRLARSQMEPHFEKASHSVST